MPCIGSRAPQEHSGSNFAVPQGLAQLSLSSTLYGITEWFGLEGSFKVQLVQHRCNKQKGAFTLYLGISSPHSIQFPVTARENFLCALSFLSPQTTGSNLTSWLDKLSTCCHLVIIIPSLPAQTT